MAKFLIVDHYNFQTEFIEGDINDVIAKINNITKNLNGSRDSARYAEIYDLSDNRKIHWKPVSIQIEQVVKSKRTIAVLDPNPEIDEDDNLEIDDGDPEDVGL